MTDLSNNRLVATFAELRAGGKKTVLPFLTGGYPSPAATTAMLREIESRGGRICEIGVPFSDPIADGPVIQASYTAALDAGVTWDAIRAAVRDYRAAGGTMAILAMVSVSIVYRHGQEAFCASAAEAGFDGLIVPDLPLDETDAFAPIAAGAGLCNVVLISPTTPEERKVDIATRSTGFVYYMSVAGITGERKTLPTATIDSVAELRKHTETPICVGFGISTPEQVAEVCRVADGAIVGSAIIHRINDAREARKTEADIVTTVGAFVESLLEPVK